MELTFPEPDRDIVMDVLGQWVADPVAGIETFQTAFVIPVTAGIRLTF